MAVDNGEDTVILAYLYGSICVFLVSLLSVVGVIAVPLLKTKSRDRYMQIFIGLAVACLSTDAVLHLIPQAIGVHSHKTRDKNPATTTIQQNCSSSNSTTSENQGVLFKSCGILAAVYVFYIFEFCAKFVNCKQSKNTSKQTPASELSTISDGVVTCSADGNIQKTGGTKIHPSQEESHDHSTHDGAFSEQEPVFWGLKPIAFMIIIGDTVHNFADGVAIGASFASSISGGLSTTFAVACHELPHEISDVLILIGSGLSVWKAVLMNILSALIAFAGLYVGLALGDEEETRKWLFAITAGMFLYVAWIDMLHHLTEESGDPWYISLGLQNIGFLTGFTALFLIAMYEQDIHEIFE